MNQNPIPRPPLGIYILGTRGEAFDSAAASQEPDRVHLAVPRFRQRLSLSCEMASLRMAAHFHKVVHTEPQLVRILPRDTTQPRMEGKTLIWADANRIFPGNIRGWQLYHGGMSQYPRRARINGWGYGIYAPGIAEVATQIGLQAKVFDQVDYVYTALDRGQVPIVIVPCRGKSTTRKWKWFSPQGDVVAAINSQHAIAVTGYNDKRVWVNDPLGQVSSYERVVFERAFALLTSGVAIGPPKTSLPARVKRVVFGPRSLKWPFWTSD